MSRKNWRTPRFTCEMFCVLKEPTNIWVDEPDVRVVGTFTVKSYGEAIEYAKAYRESHASDGLAYYWRPSHSRGLGEYGLWHRDGISSWGASDVDCAFIDRIAGIRVKMRKETDPTARRRCVKRIGALRRMSRCRLLRAAVWLWQHIRDGVAWWLWIKPLGWFKTWRWNVRNARNWRRTGHSLDEMWSLELHMLGDLKYNLKRLNEEGYGINTEFIREVLVEQHANEPNFDVNRCMTSIMMNQTKSLEVERLAVERQRQTYDRICHLVDMYTFYSNQEIDGEPPTADVLTPDMRWHFIEGTYDMLDYEKMLKESTSVWREIWELVAKYGQQMGD